MTAVWGHASLAAVLVVSVVATIQGVPVETAIGWLIP